MVEVTQLPEYRRKSKSRPTDGLADVIDFPPPKILRQPSHEPLGSSRLEEPRPAPPIEMTMTITSVPFPDPSSGQSMRMSSGDMAEKPFTVHIGSERSVALVASPRVGDPLHLDLLVADVEAKMRTVDRVMLEIKGLLQKIVDCDPSRKK